jgi:hypothetical protein
VGNVALAQIGGENQVDMPKALAGGNGWKGLTVKVMSSMDPKFDVLPNFLFAYWYSGNLMARGWHISQQGYYYLDNAITAKNCIHCLVDKPWIQPGVPLAEVKKIEMDGAKRVLTVLHDGQEQRIVWGPQC